MLIKLKLKLETGFLIKKCVVSVTQEISYPEKLQLIFSLKVTETVARRYSIKKVLLEISQNSQENTCARASFLIKLQAYRIPLVAGSKVTKCLWKNPVLIRLKTARTII